MDTILEVVLETVANARWLDVGLVSKIACVSKDFQAHAASLWSRRKVTFKRRKYKCHVSKHSGCRICIVNDVDTRFGMCGTCARYEITFLSATTAKKEWLLEDKDLARLTPGQKSGARLYDAREVKELACVRHGGLKAFMRKRHGPKPPSAARVERERKVSFLVVEDEDVADAMAGGEMGALCIDEYLANGKGGIRRVKNRVERWIAFEDLVAQIAEEDPGALEMIAPAFFEDARESYVLNEDKTIEQVRDDIARKKDRDNSTRQQR
jgi:hypothetical protein